MGHGSGLTFLQRNNQIQVRLLSQGVIEGTDTRGVAIENVVDAGGLQHCGEHFSAGALDTDSFGTRGRFGGAGRTDQRADSGGAEAQGSE